MKTPPTSVLFEHVLRDIVAEQKRQQTAQVKTMRLTCARTSCFMCVVIFGWLIAVYPGWLINRKFVKWFDFKWHSPKRFDFTLTLGLFGIDFSPFWKPEAEGNIAAK